MMWLRNIITMWNQYTDFTGGKICIQNEDKIRHGQNII